MMYVNTRSEQGHRLHVCVCEHVYLYTSKAYSVLIQNVLYTVHGCEDVQTVHIGMKLCGLRLRLEASCSRGMHV